MPFNDNVIADRIAQALDRDLEGLKDLKVPEVNVDLYKSTVENVTRKLGEEAKPPETH
jgi:hypothetical protein